MELFFAQLKTELQRLQLTGDSYNTINGHSSAIQNEGWANNIPSEIFKNGRAYQLNTGVNATVHGGASDSTIYSVRMVGEVITS